MATLDQHVLQGGVLEEGYGCVTSCVVLLFNYDESFLINFYVHLFFLYILYLGAVYEIFGLCFLPRKSVGALVPPQVEGSSTKLGRSPGHRWLG